MLFYFIFSSDLGKSLQNGFNQYIKSIMIDKTLV